jgi:TctA family transporter
MEALSLAGDALLALCDPYRFMILMIGVVIGIGVGIVPGIGGITGLAILIPFTYSLDPIAAFALLMGMAAVNATSDVIPAVLFGVPGSVGCAATVLDGHPLARKGEAGRALGACYAASLLGGVFGAVLLGVSLPLLRPLMLYLGSPELFSFCVFGLSMVAVLSGRTPLRGMAAAGLGLMIAMIGAEPQTGKLRWTFGELYLWEGLPLVPVTLGLFAVPELAELMIMRSKIAQQGSQTSYSLRGQWQGIVDVFRHWWLVLRCSWLGSALGAVPGIGSSVIDWIAYGHAARTEKNTEGFGQGDIRGVIASESSNNAKEGGALVPTIAFGVPGSASMSLLLGAFLIHGLVPGPEMLTRHLDVTYAIVWSLALANIIGAVICLFASGQLARLAYVRYSILLPVILAIAYVGAFQGSQSWGDLYTLLIFGVLGWIMKQLGWPRPPLILGFVLGDIFERYLFISVERYGMEWLLRPVVVGMFVLAAIGMVRPLRQTFAGTWRTLRDTRLSRVNLGLDAWFTIAFIAAVATALFLARGWSFEAGVVPKTAAWIALLFAGLNLFIELFHPSASRGAAPHVAAGIAMDLGPSGNPHVPDAPKLALRTVYRRAGLYFAWLLGFVVACMVIGFLPAMLAFIIGFMRIEGRETWRLSLTVGAATTTSCWLLFDRFLAMAWPTTLVGNWIPALRAATGLL